MSSEAVRILVLAAHRRELAPVAQALRRRALQPYPGKHRAPLALGAVVAGDPIDPEAVVFDPAIISIQHVGVDPVLDLLDVRGEVEVGPDLASERDFRPEPAFAVARADHVHRRVVEPVPVVLEVAAADAQRERLAGTPESDEALVGEQRPAPLLGRELRRFPDRDLALEDHLEGCLQRIGGPVDDDPVHLGLHQADVVPHPPVQIRVAAVGRFRLAGVRILVSQALRRRGLPGSRQPKQQG